jgi:hypothetical protein
MNSLSQLLYFADVLPILSDTLAILTILGMVGVVVISIAFLCEGYFGKVKNFIIGSLIVFVFMGITSIIIPSKNTIYAIAVSELGEDVYKSEIGKKATKAIEQWIDKQLETEVKFVQK